MQKRFLLQFTLLFTIISTGLTQKNKELTVQSPDGKLTVTIAVGDQITYALQYQDETLILPSPISLTLGSGDVLGEKAKVRRNRIHLVNTEITPLYGKRAVIKDHYNEMVIEFRKRPRFSLVFRVYDEGFAYKFITDIGDEITVTAEEFSLRLPEGTAIYASHPRENSFESSYEDFYSYHQISEFPEDSIAVLPALIAVENGMKIGITEADVKDYPHAYLSRKAEENNVLRAAFPKYPTSTAPGGHRDLSLKVQERANYLAESRGEREFPWRVFKIATNDAELLDTDLVYKLSEAPNPEMDFSWVKPGKVAWDWWNAWNLSGVDFETGCNTETFKYYVDFAAANGLEYINLDECWSHVFDLTDISEDVDVKEVIDYANQKGVDVFLWCVARTLDRQLEEVMPIFEEWGVKGLKIDFMDRDDQQMVDFYYRIAEAAAERNILVNFHGAYKPTGMSRAFPNVINHEAVRGLEYNKFAEPNGTTPEHAVSIPFIRMLAGPMDYTPGGMTNMNRQDFKVIFDRPVSQGTRCQQLAMYVVYEAPLQMLADAPTKYEAEPEIMEFLADVPVSWDETVALDGKVGEYAVIARRKGDAWYVGGMTDWEARNLNVALSFLDAGSYEAAIYRDGINAARLGEEYVREKREVNTNSNVSFDLAPGGGFVMKISPVN